MTTMLHAKDIMNRHVQGLHRDTPATAAVEWLTRRGHSGAPVIADDGRVEGIFSEYDSVQALLDALNESRPIANVGAYMSKDVESVSPETDVRDVAMRFAEGKHRRIVVTDADGKAVGLITRRDLVRGMLDVLSPGKGPTTYDILRQLWR